MDAIRKRNTTPLRIFGSGDTHYLASPGELTGDNLNAKLILPEIGHIEVIATNDEFKRQFFYSRIDSTHIWTTSGYLFNGPVDVYAWKSRVPADSILHWNGDLMNEIPLDQREILANIEMMHVAGDEKNLTGGYSQAFDYHKNRIANLSVHTLTPAELMHVYDAMRFHVPRY